MDIQEMHRQLLDPSAYPESTSRVEFRETHISRVYLTETHAYKIKKPLDLGFLDFTTLERRGFFCAEEIRLNRRFAPDIYLEVAELREEQGTLHFGRHGDLREFAVRMRRLPEDRMLDRMIADNDASLPDEIERLARHLVPLLASCTVCREDHLAVVRGNCEENLVQTLPAVGTALSDEAHRVMSILTDKQLLRLGRLITTREARGYVRDGHGDLHARNICMSDPIQVYDCIEFNRRFRVADIAAELAFLLMDLEFRGRRDLAQRFLATYQDEAADPDLPALLPFYKSYRAWVRGKVDALLAGEAEVGVDVRRQALERARQHFNLALGYHLPATLLLTSGLMGVGKTTLARALSSATGATLLRSDVVRKELAGFDPAQPRPDAFGIGLYAPEMTSRTYAELQRQAEAWLRRGRSVIIDAAFIREAERHEFLALAGRLSTPAHILHLQCDPALTLMRLDQRQSGGGDASDGRRELLESQVAAFEPIRPGAHLIEIDSSAAVDYNVQYLLSRLLRG